MAINLDKWKEAKKAKGLSYDDLANATGYSRSTITNIFCGYIDLPRHETVQAIEKALGISSDEETFTPTPEEMELFNLIREMTEEEVEELSNYLDFILSKRKK